MLIASRLSIAGMFAFDPVTIVLRSRCLNVLAPLSRGLRVGRGGSLMFRLGSFIL